MKKDGRILLLVAMLGLLTGALGAALTLELRPVSEDKLIEEFYLTENAVHVSPHGLRKLMDQGDQSFVLVDLRSEEEYNQEHIVGAINIPAYKNKDQSDYGAVERITNSFKELSAQNPGKDIIVYCYSTPCMTGRKIGALLAKKDVYVKHLGIGWNDWRYDWNAWNHEHEWNQTKVDDYVVSGSSPGLPKLKESTSVCSASSLGC